MGNSDSQLLTSVPQPLSKMNDVLKTMTNLFHSSAISGVHSITVDITLLSDNTVELTFKGTPQYVTYATYFTTDPCSGCIAEIDSTGVHSVKLGIYNSTYTYKHFYFIYAMGTHIMAEAVQKIFPPIRYNTREIACKNDIFMIHIADIYETKIINYGTTARILLYAGGSTQKIVPGELIVISPSYSSLSDIRIRDEGLLKDMAFRDLTPEEQENYIPEDVFSGITRTINWMSIHNWKEAKAYLYQGTLTYSETRDKDIHMVDDKGNKYRYNMETFRPMIPLLVKGVISGAFKFTARGNRNISYVLIPCNGITQEEILLCDSDSSVE